MGMRDEKTVSPAARDNRVRVRDTLYDLSAPQIIPAENANDLTLTSPLSIAAREKGLIQDGDTYPP
jgi:hypothetical protein